MDDCDDDRGSPVKFGRVGIGAGDDIRRRLWGIAGPELPAPMTGPVPQSLLSASLRPAHTIHLAQTALTDRIVEQFGQSDAQLTPI